MPFQLSQDSSKGDFVFPLVHNHCTRGGFKNVNHGVLGPENFNLAITHLLAHLAPCFINDPRSSCYLYDPNFQTLGMNVFEQNMVETFDMRCPPAWFWPQIWKQSNWPCKNISRQARHEHMGEMKISFGKPHKSRGGRCSFFFMMQCDIFQFLMMHFFADDFEEKKHWPQCFWQCLKNIKTLFARCILAMFLTTIEK